MKCYENVNRNYLTRRTPVIIRIDGKAFHTLTRNCEKPFDSDFILCMAATTYKILNSIQGAKCAYVQSDEISILLTDYEDLETDAWFKYNIQKIVSVSSSMATVTFNSLFRREAFFDSRTFNLPKEEVANYFIWRYKDWLRNSLSMFARTFYSQKELNGKNKEQVHEMLFEKGKNWAKLPEQIKNGTLFYKQHGSITMLNPHSVEDLRRVVEKFL